MRAVLQPAFILHTRPLNETSLLLDMFTESHGRIHLLAKGARSRFRGLCRPFIPLFASWSGKTDLMNLQVLEAKSATVHLRGVALLSAFYLNELLLRLLPSVDVQPILFKAYAHALTCLQQTTFDQRCLRFFEKQLLAELGYGLSLNVEAGTGEAIDPASAYCFFPEKGFIKNGADSQAQLVFSGKSLLAFHQGVLNTPEDLRSAKQITRIALAGLLGAKPLKSRELLAPPG